MGKKALNILGVEKVRMGFAAVMVDIAKDPLTIGLLGAVGIVVIPKHLPHLINKL